MSQDIVADFGAFLSVTVDDATLFETREGRIVMTRETVAVAGEDEKRTLALDSLTAFDFRTVPSAWEQFFDDLIGVRFETDDGEVVVTIGTETVVADRFVTLLLKLLLDGTAVAVRQRLSPIEGADESQAGEATLTLQPKRELLEFDDGALHAIDVSTITGVKRHGDGGESVRVYHLSEAGRLGTEITPEAERGAQFLETYLAFRREIADSAGPIQFLFLGEDRDTLTLIAKLLKHRNLPFEAAHATTVEEALESLDSAEAHTECIVSEYDLPETSAETLREQVRDRGHDAPIVFAADDEPEGSVVGEGGGTVDVIRIGSRTEHYEDVADAIERAVLTARLDVDHAAVQAGGDAS